MTSALRRLPAAAFLALAALLAACSGSPGPSPVVVDPLTISVQPSSLVIYPGVPATLLITGGTGSYVVASNNQSTVPIVTAGVGHQLTVIANPVNAETVVTLSIRDTGTTPAVTAALTVRPGTIANAVTVVPVSSECNAGSAPNVVPFLCSGGEALVTATISQGGVILPARGVRFDVVSGDVRFIVTPAGATGESLATTTTVISDQNGLARVRLRALAGAPPQNALIQITDPETLAFQRVVIPIVQLPGPGGAAFFVVPGTLTFHGPFIGQCAGPSSTSGGASTNFVVFGGTPPYSVVNANGLISVSPSVVQASGQPFTATLVSNACFTDLPITITDASGRTFVVTVSNVEGTTAAPAPPVSLAPTSLTLCVGQTGSFVISGGTPPFSAGVNHPFLTAAPPVDRTVSVTRGVAGGPGSATLSVTDGGTPGMATINTPAPGVSPCP